MKRIRLPAYAAAVALAPIAVTAAPAVTVEVPPSLRVPVDQELTVRANAIGVQVYACSNAGGGPFAWTLQAPDAELFDDSGRRIGRHFAGPTWEAADGSKVAATLKARADAPDATSIPWLLLSATSNSGTGVFARVANIQRLATHGGGAPHKPCDEARAGAETRVPYTATYLFYARAGQAEQPSETREP